ncbi:MAG: MinD/ParA family protein [Deltaproteobacteria bacterium]|nr:MinD/ParA family protein [Deltaproteobacteria bacterium]MBW2019122.1 MinD/ParA family protein [Deltaproteobacteria bacterium]MBW2073189.1 MinD/ParA family protein [Deltaproteobacteria bacterium]RLB83809.1 MAG: flagellar synthesis regulator FleN [Deltaproteobacteria bacterium]
MDQANGLRQLVRKKAYDMNGVKGGVKKYAVGSSFPRVLAVTSGKGGVGKTNIVGNLALAFRRLGKRVLILDGDLGLANIDIIFSLNPAYNIKHVISGEKDLSEVIVEGPEEIRIIPAGSGLQELVHLTDGQKLNLLNEFDSLNEDFDIFLIDTGAGISSNIIYFNLAAQERIVVATCEPSSITDAYALMKVMFTQHGTRSFKLLVNMVNHAEEAKSVFRNLSNAVVRFLSDISLEYIGFIPRDDNFQRAVRQQCTVMQCYPESKSSKGFCELAQRLLACSANTPSDGNIKFFWKKLMTCH